VSNRWIDQNVASCAWLALAVVSVTACGDSAAVVVREQTGAEPSDPGGPPDSPPAATTQGRYAVLSQVSSADATVGYVSVVESIAEGELSDTSRSLELADAGYLFGTGASARFYVLGDSAVLAAYDVLNDGSFVPGPSMSFANSGVVPGASERSVIFISETKAYLLDDRSLQAVVWNPTDMTITGSIDLGALGKEGWITYFDYRPKLRGADLVLPAYYFDDSFGAASGEAAVAFIDTLTDAVEVVRDDRCGGFSTSALDDEGDIYLASDPYVDALRRVGTDPSAPAGCVLRVRRGERRMDPDFFLQISSVLPGFGGGIARGGAGFVYIRAYDEATAPVGPGTSALDLYGRAAWRWWRLDLAGRTVAEPLDGEPGSGTLRVFEVDGAAYATDASVDYASTMLVNMSDPSGPRRGLRVTGTVAGLVRIP
jgi:hypothetical protein